MVANAIRALGLGIMDESYEAKKEIAEINLICTGDKDGNLTECIGGTAVGQAPLNEGTLPFD